MKNNDACVRARKNTANPNIQLRRFNKASSPCHSLPHELITGWNVEVIFPLLTIKSDPVKNVAIAAPISIVPNKPFINKKTGRFSFHKHSPVSIETHKKLPVK